MRTPRVRFTIRRMIVVVALVALSLIPALVAIDIQAHVHDEDWRDDFVPALRSIQAVAACERRKDMHCMRHFYLFLPCMQPSFQP
jgi:hypothetical protein